MPPPKKKAKTVPAPATVPEQPLDYANHVRAKMRERMESTSAGKKSTADYNVEQIIREIRAILAVNAEIFDRCMGSCLANISEGSWRSFQRCSFDVVKVRSDNSTVRFIAKPHHSRKKFYLQPLMTFPDNLDDKLAVKYKYEHGSKFIDYDTFFQNSLVLHEDVVGPFLANLKDQLEVVQVCLGEIDAWILEPSDNIKYIKEKFGGKVGKMLGPPNCFKDMKDCDCPQGTHGLGEACLRCGTLFGRHQRRSGRKSGGRRSNINFSNSSDSESDSSSSSESNSSSSSESEASDSGSRCSNGSISSTASDVGDENHPCKKFQCKRKYHIKECHVTGKYETEFTISKEDERKRLDKFLDYITS